MALMKYKDIIAFAKDKVTEVMAPLRAMEMKKKAELEVAKIESKIAEGEQKIQELCSVHPIDFDRIIDSIDELELIKRRKDQFNRIISEMFD